MRRFKFAAIAASMLFLAGCVPEARHAPVVTPIAFKANADKSKPFLLQMAEINIRRGENIGTTVYMFGSCWGEIEPLTWDRGRMQLGQEWGDAFHAAFSSIGYPVVGDPANPFERGRERSRAEYIVAAQITEIDLRVCRESTVNNINGGQAYVSVKWQVLSTANRRVVFEGRSEGSVDIPPARAGITRLILAAFEAAARNLGADAAFHSIVSGERDTAPTQQAAVQAAVPAAIKLLGPVVSRAPITTSMATIRAAVPTIDMGTGHGSGVFITDDGYLLTNEHVVRQRRQVTVRLQGGVEITGDVLRSDAMRDIALVKVNLSRTPAVPIRSEAVAVGEEVYAVGTPLDHRLAQTVSRGVVSAMRAHTPPGATRSYASIQSDVMIQGGNSGGGLFDRNGNLIAITYAGRGEVDQGINYFIPIDDALATLQVELTQQPRPGAR